ncbi:MAG: hypothetical protein ISN64_03625 [Rickettsia sp.]|nr:hypothetical protein [Rickettsia sp.]
MKGKIFLLRSVITLITALKFLFHASCTWGFQIKNLNKYSKLQETYSLYSWNKKNFDKSASNIFVIEIKEKKENELYLENNRTNNNHDINNLNQKSLSLTKSQNLSLSNNQIYENNKQKEALNLKLKKTNTKIKKLNLEKTNNNFIKKDIETTSQEKNSIKNEILSLLAEYPSNKYYTSEYEYQKFLNANLNFTNKLRNALLFEKLEKRSIKNILDSIEFIPSEVIDIENMLNYFNKYLLSDNNFSRGNEKNFFITPIYSMSSNTENNSEQNIGIKLGKNFKKKVFLSINLGFILKNIQETFVQTENIKFIKNYLISSYIEKFWQLKNKKNLILKNSVGISVIESNFNFKYLASELKLEEVKASYKNRFAFFISSTALEEFNFNTNSILNIGLEIIYINIAKNSFEGKNENCNIVFKNDPFDNFILSPQIKYKIKSKFYKNFEFEIFCFLNIKLKNSFEKQSKTISKNDIFKEEIFFTQKESLRRNDNFNIQIKTQLNLTPTLEISLMPRYSFALKSSHSKNKEQNFSLSCAVNFLI